MAFDLTLARGGFGEPCDSPVADYRQFYQMYVSVDARSNPATQTNWLNALGAIFGTTIDTYAHWSKMDKHARRRVLEYARCQIEVNVWSFMALGPRPPEQFLIDSHQSGNFLRKPQREVDAIIMRSEFNHITERGDDPALAAIALTALGLPSTPLALFKDWDATTARAVLSFLRIYGSAYESIVNADDNELDYQDVATGARFSAASRHDATFMDFMEFHSWLAEATFWHVSPTDLFDEITQTEVGVDALDATQAEALELFSLLRGVGQVAGKQRHMDMPKAIYFAQLSAYGYLPSMDVLLFGLTENIALRDLDGNVIAGRVYMRAQAPINGSHPQRDTWVNTGAQVFEMVVEVPAGQTPDHIEAVVDVLQPSAGTRWFNFSGPAAVDADTFTMTPVVDVAGKTRWTIDATKAAKWAAGENIIGEFVLAQGPHLKMSPANGIPVENVSLLVEDGASDESALYSVVPSRVLTGLEMPPTRTPVFAQRASGTLDNL
jgi:hypothetical protein